MKKRDMDSTIFSIHIVQKNIQLLINTLYSVRQCPIYASINIFPDIYIWTLKEITLLYIYIDTYVEIYLYLIDNELGHQELSYILYGITERNKFI